MYYCNSNFMRKYAYYLHHTDNFHFGVDLFCLNISWDPIHCSQNLMGHANHLKTLIEMNTSFYE